MAKPATTQPDINVPQTKSGFDPSRLFGLVRFLSLIGLAVILGIDIGAFINVPSLIVCIGGTITLAMFSAGAKDLAHTCKHFSRLFGIDAATPILAQDVKILRGMTCYLYASGAIGFGIGLTQILSLMDDSSAIYRGITVALLCPLYSLIGAEGILRPIAHHLTQRITSQPTSCSFAVCVTTIKA